MLVMTTCELRDVLLLFLVDGENRVGQNRSAGRILGLIVCVQGWQ